MSTIIVRYRPRDADADTNQQLIEDVFADLAEAAPDGIRYTVWRLVDGTFLHVAELDGDDNPLPRSPAFQRFLAGIDADASPTIDPSDNPPSDSASTQRRATRPDTGPLKDTTDPTWPWAMAID